MSRPTEPDALMFSVADVPLPKDGRLHIYVWRKGRGTYGAQYKDGTYYTGGYGDTPIPIEEITHWQKSSVMNPHWRERWKRLRQGPRAEAGYDWTINRPCAR